MGGRHRRPVTSMPAAEIAAGVTEPSARGIADHVAGLIRQGVIADGSRLPTVRATAAALQVGATTVATAWTLLRHERLVRSDGRNGTFVRDLSLPVPEPGLPPELPVRIDLVASAYDVDLLPDPAPHLLAAAEGLAWHQFERSEVDGDLARMAVGSWPFVPDGLAVAWGFADALAQLAALVVRPGDRVVVESACSPETQAVLTAVRAQIVRVPCDAAGMLPDALARALATRPSMVVTQPRMADPLAHHVTDERARDLAAVLAEREVLIVEEDTAACLAAGPAGSVGSWLPDQTVLVRGYQRSHGPTVRMAVVGGASAVVDRLRARQDITGSFPPLVAQRTLALMLGDLGVQEMVARARWRYARRWHALARALRHRGLAVPGVDGLALWVRVPDGPAALRRLARSGIRARLGTEAAGPAEGSRHLRLATVGLRFEHDAVAELVASCGRDHRSAS
ncbi:aminotransferase class I/II-fold pyridoxal phosphate-dependent enzyme [Mumia sp. zg.B53]|uniref:aminotransferase class I/II-fold pyridoxal phosphate-dependent enzyme n=1 Tax=unclassified Mumia TaxID=2621872 RepID=UPI001C6F01FF|nr:MULTISPECIES: aminotransferase class I/II-fold pyridoxal phosphate-dependent enzyme [unclassified Mumia]MBW9207650.1 aminotransferase class I/II-fold pyridoxal phosphate-dependent enzyme [Mumia sp. zg.B17]MBW9214608.1 aminotransferase class I/II-fold pyridoxal phosphate-dependent enzyme [Mumia sp. zg.B53]